MYAGTSHGVSRSYDNGATWLSAGLADQQVVEVVAALAGTVYAETVVPLPVGYGLSIYKSTNGGDNWSPLPRSGGQLALDPRTRTTLYLIEQGMIPFTNAFGGDLSRSTDGGLTWTRIGPSGRFVTAFALDPEHTGTIYAATVTEDPPRYPTAGTIYKTTDDGESWTPLGGASLRLIGGLWVDPFSSSTLFASSEQNLILGGPAGTYRSDDGGFSFRSIYPAPAGVLPDPNHRNRIYLATSDRSVQTSTDGGASWNPLNDGLPVGLVYDLSLDASSSFLHVISGSAVFDLQVGSPGGLTLSAGHPFTVALAATDQRTGHTGAGVATPVNDLWGYFSIPAITGNPNNPEVFVKMLDGTAINGSFWFFYGGLTDLEYTLTVTEVSTGRQKTYTKSAGSECGGSDTAAFGP